MASSETMIKWVFTFVVSHLKLSPLSWNTYNLISNNFTNSQNIFSKQINQPQALTIINTKPTIDCALILNFLTC